MKRLFLLSIFAICLNIVQANNNPNLIRPITNQSNTHKINSRNLFGLNNAIATQEIEIDIDALFNSDVVSLNIGGETFVVDRIDVVQNEIKDYIYCAYESADVEMSISKLGNNIQGIINGSSFGSYIIETVGENSYILAELDTDEIAPDGPSVKFNDDNTDLVGFANNESPAVTKYVRVLVMYTPEALSLASDMTNKVYQDINNGNSLAELKKSVL